MKLFYILFLILLTGCSVNTLGSKISEDLKVPKDDIIYSHEYTEYEYEDGEIISQKQIVSYAYKSGELVPVLKDEIIEKRTENIVTRDLGGFKRSAQSGYSFYKENGKWKQIKFATTTSEIFNRVSWLDSFIAWALDTGAISPGTMADDDSVGTVAWSDVDNAKVSDNTRTLFATGTDDYTVSHYLKATNFGFSISGGATIDGIIVEIERRCNETGGGAVRDTEVKIVKSDSSIGTTNKADVNNDWPETDTYKSYGNSSDLWNETWTVSDINNTNFGFVLSIYEQWQVWAFVDHMRITVYYSEAPIILPAATGIDIIMID